METDTLCALLKARSGKKTTPMTLSRAYAQFLTTENGAVILDDLVTRFPVIAARFVPGEDPIEAAKRDGAAQVAAYILQQTMANPKSKAKPKAKRAGKTQTEAPEDIQ